MSKHFLAFDSWFHDTSQKLVGQEPAANRASCQTCDKTTEIPKKEKGEVLFSV
jgi:hypothetical protein